jgi:hypothetical protein
MADCEVVVIITIDAGLPQSNEPEAVEIIRSGTLEIVRSESALDRFVLVMSVNHNPICVFIPCLEHPAPENIGATATAL